MTKSFRWISATFFAAALAFAVTATGCSTSDTPVTSSSTVAELTVPTESGILAATFDSYSNVTEETDFLLDPRDSSNSGGGTDDKGGKGSGKDDIRKGPSYRALPIPCLGLTDEQMVQLRTIMQQTAELNKTVTAGARTELEAIRALEKAAREEYRTATAWVQDELKALREEMKADRDAIMAQLKEGAITREEAATQLKALREEQKAKLAEINAKTQTERDALNAKLRELAAQRKAIEERVKAAIKANQDAMYRQIRAMLTTEQQAIWDAWVAGGDPCKRIKG